MNKRSSLRIVRPECLAGSCLVQRIVVEAFLNGPGDNIQRDGKAYVGGVDGTVAELQELGSVLRGNYSMPFGLTVYCPTCAAPTACPGWATGTPCAIPKNCIHHTSEG